MTGVQTCALPISAVIVPSGAKAGRRRASDSTVVSGRTPSSALTTIASPLRCGMVTGADFAPDTAAGVAGGGVVVCEASGCFGGSGGAACGALLLLRQPTKRSPPQRARVKMDLIDQKCKNENTLPQQTQSHKGLEARFESQFASIKVCFGPFGPSVG